MQVQTGHPWSLIPRHSIKNSHSTKADITTWVSDHCGKLLSIITAELQNHIYKCLWKRIIVQEVGNRKPIKRWLQLLWARRHLGWTIIQWKHVLCSDYSHFNFFFGRNCCTPSKCCEKGTYGKVTFFLCFRGYIWVFKVSTNQQKTTTLTYCSESPGFENI